jgi:4-hydroxy-2-oxoheptanedioate aldolase
VSLNPVREKLLRGEVSVGGWLNLGSPTAAEVMAAAGYDWLVVDAEHGQWDLATISNAFRAIEARGCVPMVRVWSHDATALGRLLDAGAMGIVLPHVSTPEQAAQAAQAMRYPPVGNRSSGTGRAVLMAADYKQEVDNSILVIPQIEDMEGVNNAEAIMAIEGVDVAFLGPNDLGLSMGLTPSQMWNDPAHLGAIASVLNAARKVGKPAGVPVNSGEAARRVIQQGFQFIDLGSDLRQLQVAVSERRSIALGADGQSS